MLYKNIMTFPIQKVLYSLSELLKHDETMSLLSAALLTKLQEEFDKVSLSAIHAAIQNVLPDVCDAVIKETSTWEPTRTNYEESVKLIGKRCLPKCQKLLMHIEPEITEFFINRNIVSKEESIDESYYNKK